MIRESWAPAGAQETARRKGETKMVREIKIAMALAATVTALGLRSSTDAAAGVLLRFR
jgi:hypothetical protein